ncbi:regulator of G-protein signaling 12b isoform X2 [Hemibagrus wyckioides]|uniref:regulator of G-protein signaling 12b isoform X2 n=1 Tax=Hemibagrus wyckioides TaxID=337641 RepID=UPI00266D8F19|nr:regulator of G-protein signaling 12b isoform X2 [Hemibagrus wyckioides]
MFRSSEASRRRANSQALGRVRAVEVARGRTGYGFTLSGHSPCVLSCVLKGSPADYVGLRAGDQILAVNDINVAKASHEDVVKLIGRCSGVLHLLIAESGQLDSCSSDEELGFHEHKSHWLRPKMDSKTLGINRAERVVAEMQSGGIFNMIFENSSSHSSSSSEKAAAKRRPISELDFLCGDLEAQRSDVNLLSEQEMARVLRDDSVFVEVFEPERQEADSAGILNVGMIVGYLGSIELASSGANLESDSVQAIRGCMRRLRAEHKVHSLVLLEVLHDRVLLRNDRRAVLAAYPAEKLAFSAVCPDDRRFFGLVTMQAAEDHGMNAIADEDQGSRTSCHVFLVDPELCHHKVHQGISRRFGFNCTPDPDTGGCLEFPPTSQPLLQFVSVLYRDMGESIEGVRARAFLDGDLDAQQNNSTSSNSDSGIGNFLPEEKNNRVLLVDLGANPARHVPTGLWESAQGCRNPGAQAGLPSPSPPPPPPPSINHRNGYRHEFSEPHPHSHTDPPSLSNRHLSSSSRLDVSGLPARHHFPAHSKKGAGGQRWLPVHVLREWHQGRSSDQESYSESTDGWSSANCSTLPPPMSKIPADRYRAARDIASQPHRLHAHKDEWAKKLFGTEKQFYEHQQLPQQHNGKRAKESEKKGGRFRGVTAGFPQRSSGRRSFGRSKRLSVSHSLDDLESAAVSDGELNSADLKGCGSDNSLNSNASLPSVQCHRRHPERRVAAWAVCFERLLQDPVGIRYFSEFLKKEFSEENILFWQACEFFSHVPETDKKQLSQKAREIYNSFLSSKATTPVNIDSQAQLADDILNAPRPEMFKEQQLQIFNLMKFDSYTRFLKSFLYQECMLAEVEGRPLPDPHHIPSSPTSKHSTSSERSNLSTPKKEEKKSKSVKALNEECKDEHGDKKKGSLFPWPRNRSFGKGHKKKDLGEYSFSGNDGRRESQGSLSSGASLELGTSAPGKNEGEVSRNSMSLSERAVRYCNINLPDGSCCSVPIRPGVSIREVLLGLCEKLCINLAAVDLFLVGGEKSGEKEPLDLGLPISNLDGLRVVLEAAEHGAAKDKQKLTLTKSHGPPLSTRSQSATAEDRSSGKATTVKTRAQMEKRKQKKLNIDEAEEFFELISKAQSNRADDQRGLLNKSDLVLPDFLRLDPDTSPGDVPVSSTPDPYKPRPRSKENGSALSASHQTQSLDSGVEGPGGRRAFIPLHRNPAPRKQATFGPTLSPISHSHGDWKRESGAQALEEEEHGTDLTLVGEGDIAIPNSLLLPPSPLPLPRSPDRPRLLREDAYQDSWAQPGTSPV